MNEKKDQKQEVILPRRKLSWIRFSLFCVIFIVSSTFVLGRFWNLGINILYSKITEISLIIILSLILILSGYSLFDTLYQRPILVLTKNHIFIGTKRFLRSSRLQNSGIAPHNDMKLVIVKETISQRFWLMLEEKKIIDLALFSAIETAEKHRHQLKQILSKYYPEVFVSTPIYREV